MNTVDYHNAELTNDDIDQISGAIWGHAIALGIAAIAGAWEFGKELAQN